MDTPIANDVRAEPTGSPGKDLESHGFMTELIIEAFARVGYDATVKFLPWKRALESTKSGKYDGLFTVWYPRLEDNLIAGGYDA